MAVTKEIEYVISRWEDILYSWIVRINTIKMTILPKQSIQSMQPCQNISDFFYRTRTHISKIFTEPGKTSNSQSYLEKEKQS